MYGIHGKGLSWFKSYLSNRKQLMEDFNTGMHLIICGIPQGSILGPLLFLFYVNVLPNSFQVLDIFMFADDTNLFYCRQ